MSLNKTVAYKGSGNPNWRGGKRIVVCENCGCKFGVSISRNTRFCSMSCATKRYNELNPRYKKHKTIHNVEVKHCSDCSSWKPLSDFYIKNDTWDKLNWRCKPCASVYEKQPEVLQRKRKRQREYLVEHKEKVNALRREYYRNNKKEILLTNKKYREKHPQKMQKHYSKYYYTKRKFDIGYRLSRIIIQSLPSLCF